MPDSKLPVDLLPARRAGRSGIGQGCVRALITGLLLPVAALAADGAPIGKTTSSSEPARASVTAVVAGIVGYTRWPTESAAVRLCTLGQGRGVDELRGTADLGNAQRPVTVRAASNVVDASTECEVIYVGTLAGSLVRDIVQRSLGHRVLVIGEGADFCSDGGMFCLELGAAAVRFAVNLDAVARSGLRVNPSVLRIARGAPASGQ
jgi:hypothetical protein